MKAVLIPLCWFVVIAAPIAFVLRRWWRARQEEIRWKLLGLVWIAFTAPTVNSQMPYSPNDSVDPCDDLRSVRVYAWPQCDPSMRSDCGWVLVDEVACAPGEAVSRGVWLPWNAPTTLVAAAVDLRGNEGPWSRVIGAQIPMPTEVLR